MVWGSLSGETVSNSEHVSLRHVAEDLFIGNVSSLNISILTPQSDDRALIVHLLRIIRCPPSSDRCHLIYSELPHL